MVAALETPNIGAVTKARGSQSELGEIFDAAEQTALYVDNVNARSRALEEAHDRRIDQVFKATGQRLQNPFRTTAVLVDPLEFNPLDAAQPDRQRDVRAAMQDFEKRLQLLAEQHPEAAAAIGADRPLLEDARAIARDKEDALTDLLTRREGLGKYGALFAGGFVGAFQDPVNLALIPLGAGQSKTIFTGALKAAALNATVEAGLQPFISGLAQRGRPPRRSWPGVSQYRGRRRARWRGRCGPACGGARHFCCRQQGAPGARSWRKRGPGVR